MKRATGPAGGVGAVILAAGGSARLGRPKQLLEYRGKTLLRRAIDCATDAGCTPVLVVVGAEAARVSGETERAGADSVLNDEWKEGLATSIRAGIRELERRRPDARAALLLCCDQPLITPAILATLVETFDGASGRIVACGYGGTAGIPALFERSRFDELCSRCGDRGAQDLLRRSPEHVVQVAWPEGAVDIDRVEEYERLVGSEGGGPGAVL